MVDSSETTTTPQDTSHGTATTFRNTSQTAVALRNATDPKSVWDTIQNALAELSSLQIKTVVVTDDGTTQQPALETIINLLQADRVNTIHRSFLTDSQLAPLRDFHAEQVKLALQDLQQKLEYVQKLGMLVLEVIRGKQTS